MKVKVGKTAALFMIFTLTALPPWYLGRIVTPQMIQQALETLGPWAAAAYMGLFTLLPIFFFPVAVLALAGGLLFGLIRGSLYTFAGAILNCTLMFFLARYVGRNQIEQLIHRKLDTNWRRRLDRLEGREGFFLLVILRLIPAVPYNLINYAFGLTKMPFSAYLAASAIGIIPGTLAFINIGDKALSPASPDFWFALGLLAALLAVTAYIGKKLFPKNNNT